MTRKALAALVLLAALPAPAGAQTHATVHRTVIDAAFVRAADDPAKPRVLVSATVARMTSRIDGVTASGHGSGGLDQYVVCLAYATGRVAEAGCTVTTPGRAVTDGVVAPSGASVRARVPVSGRRGGWIEADLTLVAQGTVLYTPAVAHRSVRTHGLLGHDVPAGAWSANGTVLWREAAVTGTVRTDRGLRTSVTAVPRALVPTSVLRWDVTSATTVADPDDLAARVREATLAAVGG